MIIRDSRVSFFNSKGLRIAVCVSLFFFLHSSLFIPKAWAYDFAVRLSNGDSLFFDITHRTEHHVAVIAPNPEGSDYYRNHRQPQGLLVIPSEVTYNGESYRVTAIGERAFSGCVGIRTVSIPSTVTSIGDYAFYGCTGINAPVVIGENIEWVGTSAFYGCTNLPEVIFRARRCREMGGSMSLTVFGNCRSLKSLKIEEGVRMIPDYAFCGMDGLNDTLRLPSTLESIGNYAFAYCNMLKGRLTIPDKVLTIGECAFHQCHSFSELVIGSSVGLVEGRAFFHCVGLRAVQINSLAPPVVQSSAFSELRKGVVFKVPCASKSLYVKDEDWKIYAPFQTFGPCSLQVTASVEDSLAGIVTGSGAYAYGDSATLAVVCASGYGFDGWSDGVKENPRRIKVTGNMKLEALTVLSGVKVVRDTVVLHDTVWRDGIKVIYDTVDLQEVAQTIKRVEEVVFDAVKKRLSWKLKRGEKVLSVTLYNQLGECVYSGNGRRGHVDMRRQPSGSYIVRIECEQRIIRCRFFVKS